MTTSSPSDLIDDDLDQATKDQSVDDIDHVELKNQLLDSEDENEEFINDFIDPAIDLSEEYDNNHDAMDNNNNNNQIEVQSDVIMSNEQLLDEKQQHTDEFAGF